MDSFARTQDMLFRTLTSLYLSAVLKIKIRERVYWGINMIKVSYIHVSYIHVCHSETHYVVQLILP
jgi:hypothetical protein